LRSLLDAKHPLASERLTTSDFIRYVKLRAFSQAIVYCHGEKHPYAVNEYFEKEQNAQATVEDPVVKTGFLEQVVIPGRSLQASEVHRILRLPSALIGRTFATALSRCSWLNG